MSSLQPLPDPSVPGTAIALSLDLLLGNLPGAAYRCHCDREWSMEFISDGIEALTGYSAAAFTALPALSFASLILDEDLAQTYAAVATALSSGTPFQVAQVWYDALCLLSRNYYETNARAIRIEITMPAFNSLV